MLVSSQFENNNNCNDHSDNNTHQQLGFLGDQDQDLNVSDLSRLNGISDLDLNQSLTANQHFSDSYLADLDLQYQLDAELSSARSRQRSQSPPDSLWIPVTTNYLSSTQDRINTVNVGTAGTVNCNSEFITSRSDSAKYNGDNLAGPISPISTSALQLITDHSAGDPTLREPSICAGLEEATPVLGDKTNQAETCPTQSTLLTPAETHYGVEQAVLGSEDPISAAINLLSEPRLPGSANSEQPSPMRHHSPLYHSPGLASATSLHHRSAAFLPTADHLTASAYSAGLQPTDSFLHQPSASFEPRAHHDQFLTRHNRPLFTRSQSVPEQHNYLDSADEELLLEAQAATLDDPLPYTPSVVINQPLLSSYNLIEPTAPGRTSSRLSSHHHHNHPTRFSPRPISLSSDWLPTSRRSAAAQDRHNLSLLQADLHAASQKTRRLTTGHSKRRTTRTSPPLTLGRTLELVAGGAEQQEQTQQRNRNRPAYQAAAALAAQLAADATKVKRKGKLRVDSEEWRLQHAHLLNDPTLFPSGLGIEQDAWMSVEDVRTGRWARWDALVKQESQETRDSGIETGSCFTSSEDSHRGSASEHLNHYHGGSYHKKVVGRFFHAVVVFPC